jgi:hypothetical protein
MKIKFLLFACAIVSTSFVHGQTIIDNNGNVVGQIYDSHSNYEGRQIDAPQLSRPAPIPAAPASISTIRCTACKSPRICWIDAKRQFKAMTTKLRVMRGTGHLQEYGLTGCM